MSTKDLIDSAVEHLQTTPTKREGAGGGVSAKPIGAVEISGQDTKFIPFAQTKKLVIVVADKLGSRARVGVAVPSQGRLQRGAAVLQSLRRGS